MKGRTPWNKGLTKDNHPSLMKMSLTMSGRMQSNFRKWEVAHPVYYAQLERSPDSAEFYGVLLGDGCVERYPRTEKLTLCFNSKEQKRIGRLAKLTEEIFKKKPTIRIRKDSKCVDVYLYQKHISSRLDFPTGIKIRHELRVPAWIKRSNLHLVRCLKGMFESDGNLCVDSNNHTCVIKYTSYNHSLLEDVYNALLRLGYNPQFRHRDVRLARKLEVAKFIELISFSKD